MAGSNFSGVSKVGHFDLVLRGIRTRRGELRSTSPLAQYLFGSTQQVSSLPSDDMSFNDR